MTEKQWLTATDPEPSLAFLRGRASERKMRLFAVEYCRLCRHRGDDPVTQEWLQIIEDHAEGRATNAELDFVCDAAWAEAATYEVGPLSPPTGSAEWDEFLERGAAVRAIAWSATRPTQERLLESCVAWVSAALHPSVSYAYEARPILHDIFGNPFRPVAIDPAWLTSDVLALARGIYDDLAFDRMPILADALQDAGCDNDDVLNHCRDTQLAHVRGCWVVDLLLGKA